ncbi:hypothetical protein HanRHA438_Chr08g0348201 [Helianthus annuus]|nr:hypothetical protein HanHA89_Chr08g0295521 [Helianthus annuus]KAJ0897668.1 hypothetical protein HanRHA438_Chr08g0348201 [Helianthus annuus]
MLSSSSNNDRFTGDPAANIPRTFKHLLVECCAERAIVFALSQIAYGTCIFLCYWGYLLLLHGYKTSVLFPFRVGNYIKQL